jgi:hypothetical protein
MLVSLLLAGLGQNGLRAWIRIALCLGLVGSAASLTGLIAKWAPQAPRRWVKPFTCDRLRCLGVKRDERSSGLERKEEYTARRARAPGCLTETIRTSSR